MTTKRDKMNADFAMVKDRYGKTLGASKGRTVKPEVKFKASGTNPLKKRIAGKVTVTW